MRLLFAVIFGKFTYFITQLLKLGAGGTWPGEVALFFSSEILQHFIEQLKKNVIVIAGTNGKTTTSLMIKKILQNNGETVVHNDTGANLLNGIASAFIKHSDWLGKINVDWGVFEVDENTLPLLINNLHYYSSSEEQSDESRNFNKDSSRLRSNNKLIIVLLNLFRDQLDRYGEVDVIAEKWENSLRQLSNDTLILNADDPQIAHIGILLSPNVSSRLTDVRSNNNAIYFGINNKNYFLPKPEHAVDSIFCLNCGGRLKYEGIYYSHLGIWKCVKCGQKRPQPEIRDYPSPLPGVYSLYNTLAAVGVARTLKIRENIIKKSISAFIPAFGRQEEFAIDKRKIKIYLSKNPTGFNQSLRTVIELGAKHILFVLNDRIPDGRDVSWIWDVDFEMIPEDIQVIVSGDRVYDMALRMKYTKKNVQFTMYNLQFQIEPDLKKAIDVGLKNTKEGETLYILPTYSAMLEVRQILTGRKIL